MNWAGKDGLRQWKKLKFLTLAVAVLLTGCGTPGRGNFPKPTDYVLFEQMEILGRYPGLLLTGENLSTQVRKCIPTMPFSASSVSNIAGKLPLPRAQVSILSHASSASSFMVMQDTGVCIRTSERDFPVFAAEALLQTANPTGPSPDVVEGWNRQIVKKIAQTGIAKVAYQFANGNAFVATYWVGEKPPKSTIQYNSNLRKKGEWESESLDFRFSHPDITSFSTTERDGQKQKVNLLDHRLR
jgi:hypothetical protein